MISAVGVIGAGSMGTAVAQSISRRAGEIIIFGRRQEVVDSINTDNCNKRYFPGLRLNPNIRARLMNDRLDVADCAAVIIAVPSSEVRSIVNATHDELTGKILITVAKGLEYPSLKTMSEIIRDETGNPKIACFSGPTFADEIAYGHIAGATIGAADDPSLRATMSDLFGEFILDFSDDIRAVELCGVLKNVYAIGTGMWDSVYGNHNEHYTFLNMCYKEMCTFLKAVSLDEGIFTKFCCFGDFNLTANVDKSRNRTLGLMVGKNIIKTPYSESGVTFEGSKSVKGIIELANNHGVDMPIAKFVYDVLGGNNNVRKSVDTLIRRTS
ncbi:MULTISPECIES: NAD(P)H-dependent glycerol-3-phosphate dehydrogenase [unclassified Methanoculleus]|uniref:NAD(P)H-dependent glycerol-3-phosphate dehydrogenase n=1 Tax=unclassified Methanoculleus TaxID=2619537 RepID=UPI0025EB34D2|nr:MULTISPECIES: NAD(P)H-dependent glycerol-3-phosphate dehydrogenase [unclassified Methanoculleus]